MIELIFIINLYVRGLYYRIILEFATNFATNSIKFFATNFATCNSKIFQILQTSIRRAFNNSDSIDNPSQTATEPVPVRILPAPSHFESPINIMMARLDIAKYVLIKQKKGRNLGPDQYTDRYVLHTDRYLLGPRRAFWMHSASEMPPKLAAKGCGFGHFFVL